MPAGVRLTHPRLVGVAGSTLMAAGAYGAGATPDDDWSAAVPWAPRLGLVGWYVGLALLAAAWWRLGRPAIGGPTDNSARLAPNSEPTSGLTANPGGRALAVTGALWALPLLLAPPTGSRDVYAYACQGWLWLAGVDPYRTGVQAGGCPWAESVSPLWRDTLTPYGPLALLLSGAAVALARVLTGFTAGSGPEAAADARAGTGQLLVAVALLRILALGGALLIARYLPRLARSCGVDPVAAGWLALLSPVVAVHLVSGAHNDALLAGLVVAALATVAVPPAGPATVAAGGLLGLAMAIKVTAIVAVPFAVLLAATVPSPGTARAIRSGPADSAARTGPGGGTGWRRLVLPAVLVTSGATITFAGLTVLTGLDLGWVRALSATGQLVQWTSLPTGVGMAVGYLLRLAGRPEWFDSAVSVARLVGLVALAAVLVALAVRAWCAVRRVPAEPAGGPPVPGEPGSGWPGDAATGPVAGRPTDPEVATARRQVVARAGLALTAVAVLSPVFYPWYAITAGAVLAAGVADRRHRRWLAAALLVLGFLVLPDGLGLATMTKVPGAFLDVILVMTVAVLAVRRIRSSRPCS